MSRKKRFCLRNHDTSVVGRDKHGTCKECKLERQRKYKPGERPEPKKLCKRGHDISIVGRGKDRSCNACKRERHIRTYVPHVRKRKQFCLRKHDTFICGRDENGMCIICKKIVQDEYTEIHREEFRLKIKKWTAEHPDKVKEYRQTHKKEILERNTQYRRAHPGMVRATNIKQDAQRKLRIVAWTDWENIHKIDADCPNGMEVDHHIPLLGKKVAGLHVSWNLQYLDLSKNRSKGNRINLLEASEWYGKILEKEGLK